MCTLNNSFFQINQVVDCWFVIINDNTLITLSLFVFQVVHLMFSDKIQFPGFLGWFRFQWGAFWYYLRITIRGLEVQRFSINGSCKRSFLGLFNWCGSAFALKAGKGGERWIVFRNRSKLWEKFV